MSCKSHYYQTKIPQLVAERLSARQLILQCARIILFYQSQTGNETGGPRERRLAVWGRDHWDSCTHVRAHSAQQSGDETTGIFARVRTRACIPQNMSGNDKGSPHCARHSAYILVYILQLKEQLLIHDTTSGQAPPGWKSTVTFLLDTIGE